MCYEEQCGLLPSATWISHFIKSNTNWILYSKSKCYNEKSWLCCIKIKKLQFSFLNARYMVLLYSYIQFINVLSQNFRTSGRDIIYNLSICSLQSYLKALLEFVWCIRIASISSSTYFAFFIITGIAFPRQIYWFFLYMYVLLKIAATLFLDFLHYTNRAEFSCGAVIVCELFGLWHCIVQTALILFSCSVIKFCYL